MGLACPWAVAIDSRYVYERNAYFDGQRALAGRRGGGGRLGLVGGLGGLSAYTKWVIILRNSTYLVLFPWWVWRPPWNVLF